MRVAIVVPQAAAGTKGGAERAWEGLRAAIERLTDHRAELVDLPVEEHNLVDLVDGYRRFAELDLSDHDLVISSKYPAWIAHHPHHVLHLYHPLRGLYDTYHLTRLPPTRVGRPRSAALAHLLDLVRRPLGNDPRAGLPGLLAAFDLAVTELGRDHPELALPGPVAREVVHRLDAIALHPTQIRRHLALSRTVAGRPDYFPLGVTPDVVHLPSDLPGLSPGPATGRSGFFTASRIDGPKRFDLLVDAMAHVTADVPLTIAGTGPQLDLLQRRAASDARITFLGSVSDEELAERYRTAIAVPFVPADEDYGLITVEAFASGTPVVTTTDAGGPTELVVNGVSGLVVPPEPEALARALGHLAGDTAWATHLGANGLRRAEEITWESAVAAILGEAAPAPVAAVSTTSGRRRRYVVPSTYPIDPPRGGGQLRYRHLYGALARHADVHIVSLVNPPRPTRTTTLAPGLTETVVGVSERQLQDDVRLTHATGIPTTDIVAGRSIDATPAYVDELRNALADADAVILSHPFLLPAIEATGSDLPFVYDAHNAEAEMKTDVLGSSSAGRELAAWTAEVEGRAVRRATHVVACSDEDVVTLRRWFPRDEAAFVVIPNGTDADRAVPTPEERRERSRAWRASWAAAQEVDPPVTPEGLAVFFASWHPPNNDAAEVLISIAPQLPEVVFVLAGSHSDLFRTRALPPNIVLAGVVSDAAKATLLAAADLAVNPMRLGSGTNLKIVEYFAAGVPAVSTPFGVRGLDVSGDHLMLAEIADLPTAIRTVLAEPDAAATRAAAARALVLERYDWQALGDTLAELLEGDL